LASCARVPGAWACLGLHALGHGPWARAVGPAGEGHGPSRRAGTTLKRVLGLGGAPASSAGVPGAGRLGVPRLACPGHEP
jgi:hypothetical protein